MPSHQELGRLLRLSAEFLEERTATAADRKVLREAADALESGPVRTEFSDDVRRRYHYDAVFHAACHTIAGNIDDYRQALVVAEELVRRRADYAEE